MSEFQPTDPGFAERVRASFARQAFMEYLGARMTDVGPGTCEIRLPYREELSQQHGFFHGGVIGALADNSAGYAGFSMMGAADSVLTIEYKINLMAPGRGPELVARGRVIKPGRTLTITRADVFSVEDGRETLCATAQQTLLRLADSPDRPAAD